MKNEIMITIAPVPGEKQDEKYPGQIDVADEAIRCEAAGAAIVHLHARDEKLLQSVDPTLFARQVGQIRKAWKHGGTPCDYQAGRHQRRIAGTNEFSL